MCLIVEMTLSHFEIPSVLEKPAAAAAIVVVVLLNCGHRQIVA